MNCPIASAGAAAISRASRACAPQQRQHRLRAGERHGERQREMAEFGDHPHFLLRSARCVFQVAAGGGGPGAGFQWPDFFSASATSFGM